MVLLGETESYTYTLLFTELIVDATIQWSPWEWSANPTGLLVLNSRPHVQFIHGYNQRTFASLEYRTRKLDFPPSPGTTLHRHHFTKESYQDTQP